MRPSRLATVAVVTLMLPLLVHATEVCRWKDEAGRTQISDVVPDRYRKSAVCTDSQQYELTDAQRRAALQRVAEDRSRARAAAMSLPAQGASSAPGPAPAASAPAAKRPTELITATTDCPTAWRICDESVACFGPFRTTRGATKPEAFESCRVVPSPETQCGPKRD